MSKEVPLVPKLNLASALGPQTSNPLVTQPPSDFVPKPPSAQSKTSFTPSLRQSNTALIPQSTPIMIGKNSSCSELPYKKMLRGRLGVRTPREVQQHSIVSSKSSDLPGSQTFRSTMEVLNSRCGSFSARTSKSASSSESHRVSDSVASWFEHRTQAISAFGAPLFGFCHPVDGPNGSAENIAGKVPHRPQSTGHGLTKPLTGISDVRRRPTTSTAASGSANTRSEPAADAVISSRHNQQLACNQEAKGFYNNIGSVEKSIPTSEHGTLAKLSAGVTHLSTVSSFREPNHIAVQELNNPLGLSSGSPNSLPTPEQARAEVTKGQPLKKFSHVNQRAAIKVFRVNSNAELLIDEVLYEKVVSIFDGLSPFSPPKRSLNSEEDFVPKYNYDPEMAFHILLINDDIIDVIADSTWAKHCWLIGIRLILAQMKSKFDPLPTRLPDFDSNDLSEEVVRRMKWLDFLRATIDRLEDERKKKESILHSLELREKEMSDMYDAISKPVGLTRVSDLSDCVARMDFINIQLDQDGITLKHQESEQCDTTQVCQIHLQEMSSIVADASTYVKFIRSQRTEVLQQTRRLEIERNCFKEFFFRNHKEMIDRMKHRRMFHQQIKNEVTEMELAEKSRGVAILERSRKLESDIEERRKRHAGTNLHHLTFFQGAIDSSLVSLPSSSIGNHPPGTFCLLKGSLVSTSQPPRGHHLTMKTGFEWMMVTAGIEDLSAFVQHVISQRSNGHAMRAATEASLSSRELKNEELNQVLSELSQVYSATEPSPLGDIADISKLVSSSVAKIRESDIAIRWHQRKEALFIGYTEEAKIACFNIHERLSKAVSLYHSSRPPRVSTDIKSRSRLVKRTESSSEPLLSLLFSNLHKKYDMFLSAIDSSSISTPPPADHLVELTHHNTRVQLTASADELASVQPALVANSDVTANAALASLDGSLNAQPVKPKSPGNVVPAEPLPEPGSRHEFPGVKHFKYRKAESKKFKIPRMFQHLQWEKTDADETSTSAVGLYDKNGRRVRIAHKKKIDLDIVDDQEEDSSDDSSGVPQLEKVKVVNKRFLKEQSRKYDEANALKQVHEPAQVQNAAKPLLR